MHEQLRHSSLRRSARALAAAALMGGSMLPASRSAIADDTPISARADANGPARESLLLLAQPLWSDLSPALQTALQPFADEWNGWPAAEKLSWISLAKGLPQMAEAKREKTLRRISEWANLSPEQRLLARANYRLAKQRSANTRASEWDSYRSMTKAQQDILREAGSTSNTAARHAGASTGLAKKAAQPLPRQLQPLTPESVPAAED